MLCIMKSVTEFVAAAVMFSASVSIAGAQAATSLAKPISFGISGGAAVPAGDLSNGTFIEARYHRANQDSGSVSFVPITVGVMF